MICIKKSEPDDVDRFIEIEGIADTARFIIPDTRENHSRQMENPDMVYLSIFEQNILQGLIILQLDTDPSSVEFKRIVVDNKGKGIGQKAITLMEQYCAENLGRRHIWLDVFEFNIRGRHVYEKLGYCYFKSALHDNNVLRFYEKTL